MQASLSPWPSASLEIGSWRRDRGPVALLCEQLSGAQLGRSSGRGLRKTPDLKHELSSVPDLLLCSFAVSYPQQAVSENILNLLQDIFRSWCLLAAERLQGFCQCGRGRNQCAMSYRLCTVAGTHPGPRVVGLQTGCVAWPGGQTFLPLNVRWNDQAETGCQATLEITEAG